MGRRLLDFGLPKAQAERKIRSAAANTTLLGWSAHAKGRMRQRQVTDLQVVRCLARGEVGRPKWDAKGRMWKCNVQAVSAGERITVVVALERDEADVIVVTVIV